MKHLRKSGYQKIINNPLYIVAKGDLPVCLIAHMDTVFPSPPEHIYYDQEAQVMWSPEGLGGDDKAGIIAILELIERGYRPSIIFTDLEERGAIGASTLVQDHPSFPFDECKALIQLDRRGENDAVYYDCDNFDFEKKITSYGFETLYGSFSDISILAPEWGIAAVNLSVGYENEHSYVETLNLNYLQETIEKVENILKDCKDWETYEYIPFIYPSQPSFLVHSCVNCNKPIPYGEGYWCDPASRTVKLCNDCYKLYNPKIEI